MSRYSSQSAYSHSISYFLGTYEISWFVDRYYSGSRLRHPTRTRRHTDKAGAIKFAKKHNINFNFETNTRG